MKLSIVIPCYNIEQYIERCLVSVIASIKSCTSFDKVEIITVDDGSTDSTAQVIKRISYSDLIYIHQENQGLSDARNNGIEVAIGDYIWCIDGDDYIQKDAISNIFDLLKQYTPDLLMVELIRKLQSGIENPNCVQPLKKNVYITGRDAILHGYNPCSVCSAIIKRRFIVDNQLRFYKRLYHQDVQFMYRAMTLASKVVFTDIRPYIYEIRENSISTSKDTNKIIKRYVDNAIIAKTFDDFAEKINDTELKRQILKHSKQIVIGTIYSLRHEINKEIISDTLKGFEKLNLFPIKKPQYTLKHYFLSLYLNRRYSKYL